MEEVVSRREAIQAVAKVIECLKQQLPREKGIYVKAKFEIDFKYEKSKYFWDEFAKECYLNNISWTTKFSDTFDKVFYSGELARIY